MSASTTGDQSDQPASVPPLRPAKTRESVWEGAILIASLVALTYFPSVNGGFVLDDELYSQSDLIRDPDGLYRFWFSTQAADYWPLTSTSFWIEWRLWGHIPTGYHVVNLVLHVAAALLIWAILRKLSIPGAFLAALLFAVHPVNVQSVAWIAQRKSVLAMVLFLTSILLYLTFEEQSSRAASESPGETNSQLPRSETAKWYWLSLLAFALAMLSKGSVAILPLLLLGLVYWRRQKIVVNDLVLTAPFFALAMVLTVVNIWFQSHGLETITRNVNFAQRFAGAGAVVWFYLSKVFLPIHLVFIYRQWTIQTTNFLWWIPLFSAVFVTALLLRRRRGSWCRPILFSWLFFCVSLAPVLGFVEVGFMLNSLVADHYQHIATIGVLALVGAAWSTWHERSSSATRSTIVGIAIVSVAALAVLTWRQNRLYANPITLYQATVAQNPTSWLAQNNLATALFESGHSQESIEHYQQALQSSPDHPQSLTNLGRTFLTLGRLPEAIESCQRALELNPNYADAHGNLGEALFLSGRPSEGIAHLRQAQKLKPNSAKVSYNLALALTKTGQWQESLDYFDRALQLENDYFDAALGFGVALLMTNRTQEAIRCLEQATQLRHDSVQAYSALSNAYAKAHRFAQAIQAAETALALAQSQKRPAEAHQVEELLNSLRAADAH